MYRDASLPRPPHPPQVCNKTEAARSANPNRGAGAGCPSTCGQADAPPVASAPFYGMLFTQMALQGLPDIVAVRAGLNPRVERELTAQASRVE